MHCSTAYVNVYMEGEIEEKQYPAPCDPYKLIDVRFFNLSTPECDGTYEVDMNGCSRFSA